MKTKKELKLERISKVMELIKQDMEDDVKNFEGKPLTGLAVGTIHGTIAAAIVAIADSVKQIVDEELIK